MWTWHANLHFGLISLLVHDFKNHAACFRGPLWGGMDGDRLLRGPRVFFPVDVYPVGKESGAIAHRRRGHDPSSSRDRAAPANVQHRTQTDKAWSSVRLQTVPFPTAASSAGGSCAELGFFAAPFTRAYFWQACHGTRAPGQLGHDASWVSEVFCAVFQMTVEERSKVSRVNTARWHSANSEWMAAF